MRGLAVISSQPMIPRTVCYLCASTGKHSVSVAGKNGNLGSTLPGNVGIRREIMEF